MAEVTIPTSRRPGARASVTSSNLPPRLAGGRCGGQRIPSGDDPPPDEEAEAAAPLKVGRGHRAGVYGEWREGVLRSRTDSPRPSLRKSLGW